MTQIINMKTEVETVLGRPLVGHEKAIVAHLRNHGMMNPVDVAKAMITRHIANQESMVKAHTERLAELQAELDAIVNFSIINAAPAQEAEA